MTYDPHTLEPEEETKEKPKPNKHNDRFGCLNQFVDTRMATLTRAELAVWFVLYRDTRNGKVQISQNNIARRAGCKVLAVKRSIKSLINRHLIELISKGNNITNMPSVYRVL